MKFDSWLEERIGATSLARPVLLLCRTDAQAHDAKIWAAARQGALGLDIASPRQLANSIEGPRFDRHEPGDLPDNAFTRRIAGRTGLLDVLKRHARAWRLANAAGPVSAPPWLEEIAKSGWEDDTGPERRLLELARARGTKLTPSARYHRVVTLGFERKLEPWEEALLEPLGVTVTPSSERQDPGQALEVSDPAAEARWAAQHARTGTLILVQHEATAARVHRALHRNGMPSSLHRSLRLDRHTLAAVIRRCTPWFTGASDPPLRAVDLHAVLRHPMVGDHLPACARLWLEDELQKRDLPPNTGLNARGVARALREARHLHAPLSAWIAEVRARTHRDHPANALRLLARLEVLRATLAGVPFQETFPVEGPEDDPDWEDFDSLIASLVQDGPPEDELAEPGTIGCLRRFLLACRIRTRDDPAAFAILGALRKNASRPATRTDVLKVLAGAAERDVLERGVQILTYDAYDGRPARQVILLDVHDQGLAARNKPDPLLTEVDLTALGKLDPRATVQLRIEQLRWACARADSSVAIVARHDTMGRALVPPVQLRLDPTDAGLGAYGLAADLPEKTERTALQVVDATHTPSDDPYAVQASVEWARWGQGATVPPQVENVPGTPTLTHRLYTEPLPAPWLRPWLGDASAAPEARLDDRSQSASNFFKPLTHCLYQAYLRQLGLREVDEVGAELDAREIGHAVHGALEQVATRAAWSASAELDAVRDGFLDALERSTEAAFDEALKDFGTLSPARSAAARGLERRWTRHWKIYAMRRLQRAQAERSNPSSADALVYGHHFVDTAARALELSGQLAELDIVAGLARRWVLDASKALAGNESVGRSGLPASWQPVLDAFRGHPSFQAVIWLRHESRRLTVAARGPVRAVGAEIPFGDLGEPGPFGLLQETGTWDLGLLDLRLGEERVAVRGRIDRIDIVEQSQTPLARIVDYKTGRRAPSDKQGRRHLMRLVEPQLIIYALALRQAIQDGAVPDEVAGTTVAMVGWDHPRAVKGEKNLDDARDGYPLDDATLDVLGRAIGNLVGRARRGEWSLHPHPDTCPQINGWSHDRCPFVGACRFGRHA